MTNNKSRPVHIAEVSQNGLKSVLLLIKIALKIHIYELNQNCLKNICFLI